MQITSIKSPPEGCDLWSGMAILDGKRHRWFIELDGSTFDVEEEDLECKIRTHGERTCFMYIDPPDGAKEVVLKAIRGALS